MLEKILKKMIAMNKKSKRKKLGKRLLDGCFLVYSSNLAPIQQGFFVDLGWRFDVCFIFCYRLITGP